MSWLERSIVAKARKAAAKVVRSDHLLEKHTGASGVRGQAAPEDVDLASSTEPGVVLSKVTTRRTLAMV
ncbi:hypothetical protein EB796_024481 [Bugula neritina]|uniref:Uncharacterized protein n=1 Tax=Bugula neritina TaxID=10212 RepID=A0A7J7IUL0_BUGNE|nr:hypothetical protein EB796_024481 [Bugula neritina]